MRHLNYGHLMYFWVVAKEGSIVRASEVLHVTPQTISGQLKLLDEAVGERLFDRSGRNLVLSSTGRMVFQYADEIFKVGAELAQVVRGEREGAPKVLSVGVVDSIPKLVAARVLGPVLDSEESPRLHCEEGSLERLLGELAVHRLDMILSDQPVPGGLHVRAFNHPLGASDLSFFLRPGDLRASLGAFPHCLDGAPMLLPTAGTVLRRRLDDWFESIGVSPRVVAEFADSALLKAFGESGAGIFPAPSAIAEEVEETYGVEVIGVTDQVRERFYAISPERRLKHPSVACIIEAARGGLRLQPVD